MLGLIPLALSIAPELAQWLFGGKAEAATAAVATAFKAVTGAAEPEAAQAALDANPGLATQLRVQLAQVAAGAAAEARQSDLTAVQAMLADRAGARAQTVDLAKVGGAIAWGAPVVSIFVLGLFGFLLLYAMQHEMPAASAQFVWGALGSLGTMAAAVVSYWVGGGILAVHQNAAVQGHLKTALAALGSGGAAAQP